MIHNCSINFELKLKLEQRDWLFGSLKMKIKVQLEYKKLFVCLSVFPVSPIVTNIIGWDLHKRVGLT